MKNFLRNSTFALIGVALTSGLGQAAAPVAPKEAAPSLRFSGETSVNYFTFNQSQREGNGGKGNGQHAGVEDSRLNAEILGKTAAFGGLEYSALLGLSGNKDNGNPLENRIKLKNELGTAILGNTRGVDDFMAVGAFGVMGGTGGFAGNYTNVINQSTGVILTTDIAGRPKDTTKFTYVTPRFNGVQAGVTLTPSAVQSGDKKLATTNPSDAKSAPFDKNQVGLGLNFKQTLPNGVDVKLSATGLLGNTQAPRSVASGTPNLKYRNTKAYALGAVFGYKLSESKSLEVGGEFIDNGKSQTAKQMFNGINATTPLRGNDAGKVFSIALGYSFDKSKVAVGYYDSARKLGDGFKKAKAKGMFGTYDYKIGPGLGVYADTGYVDQRTDDRAVAQQVNLKNSPQYVSKNDIPDGVKSSTAKILIVGTKMKW